MSKNLQKLGEDVVGVLCQIYDPEIPVNIYELGLIYDVQVSDDYEVKILMTFTAPNCPVAETLPVEIKESDKSDKSVDPPIEQGPPAAAADHTPN